MQNVLETVTKSSILSQAILRVLHRRGSRPLFAGGRGLKQRLIRMSTHEAQRAE